MLNRRGLRDPESGSVVLALLVMMVVTLLGIAVLSESQRALGGSRRDTDEGRALASAELAVNEAFARIDAGEVSHFAGAGAFDNADYSFDAQPAGRSTWDIQARATSGDTTRAFTATVSREALFSYTLFATSSIEINRNTGRIRGRVGTNGSMDITGPAPGDVQELYLPDGICSGCTDPVTLDGPRAVPSVEFPDGSTQECPEDGLFEEDVDGRSGIPYICDDSFDEVVFEGEVRILNPPLIVYVDEGVDVELDEATVVPPGRASGFQLFVASEDDDDDESISASEAEIKGLIFAPGRSLRTDDFDLTGSITLRSLEVPRRGDVSILADVSLLTLGDGSWRLVDLRSVPPKA